MYFYLCNSLFINLFLLFFSTLSLAVECLKSDFCRQLRAHGLVYKIMILLKDAIEHPVSVNN